MTNTGRIVLIIITLLALVLLWGKVSWYQYTSALFEKVYAEASGQRHYFDTKEISDLPGPVQRYFRLVLKEGAPMISHAFVSQKGGFRADPEREGWSDMEAEQYYSVRPVGFVWNASIAMFPLLSVDVCDSYIEGKGRVKGRFVSLFRIVDAHGTKELDSAALQRYLAEAVWFPTALLPSQGVTWQAIDDHKAKATLSDGNNSVSLEFGFNDEGEIVSVYAPDRYREVSGTYTATPWQGRYGKYIDVDGYRIPSEAEVEWQLEEQTYPYWRATIEQVKYD